MMNSWQEWVVALLLLFCAVRIGMSIYSFSHRVKEMVIRVIVVQVAVN